MKCFLLLLTLMSCSKHEPVATKLFSNDVRSKAELYKSLHKGWAHDKCDSMGFTALSMMAGGSSEANIFQAEGEPGRWYRSPEHDCLAMGESKSDISKDMFIMLFNYLWKTKDKAALSRIHEYGAANNWIMGNHNGTVDGLARVFMTPPMSLLLGKMIGNIDLRASRAITVGFEGHLDALWIFLGAQVNGGMSDFDLNKIKSMANNQPRNALYQAIKAKYDDGDQTKTIEILSDLKLFPSDRLPSSSDRCEQYLWQRDDGQDWQPCGDGKTHDGVDLLISAYVADLI